MKLRPKPIPTVATAAVLAMLLSLGTWQLRRNAETNAKLAAFAEQLDAPPIGSVHGSPSDLWHRQATLAGTFRAEPRFLIGRAESSRPGYAIVQVLDLESGESLLVERGWALHARLDEAIASLPSEEQVTGVLLPLQGAGLKPLPAQDGIQERWPARSSAAMAQTVGTALVPALLVVGEETHPSTHADPADLLVTGWWVRPTTRPHLEYAATWFAIAAVLIWIWLLASKVED